MVRKNFMYRLNFPKRKGSIVTYLIIVFICFTLIYTTLEEISYCSDIYKLETINLTKKMNLKYELERLNQIILQNGPYDESKYINLLESFKSKKFNSKEFSFEIEKEIKSVDNIRTFSIFVCENGTINCFRLVLKLKKTYPEIFYLDY